jgi:uncharacterized protein (TIGR02300 family)
VNDPNYTRIVIVAKAELGTKRICPDTGRKFYDLNKEPVISPYTGKVVPVEPLVRARPEPPVARAPATVPVEEVAAPEPQEVETVSLEEADAEAQGAKKPAAAPEAGAEAEEEEVEMDETLDDSTFIEEQEEEDADVTDIIGGDIENEEEG